MPTKINDSRLDALRTPGGDFAMVALDQRESLREMFPRTAGGDLVSDAVLAAFKSDATRQLSPGASGVLLDYPLGVAGDRRPEPLAEDAGLLLAADRLHSARGQGVLSTDLDPAVDEKLIDRVQADALKFLVIWREEDDSFRPALDAFHELAARASRPTFVEGIVRPPHGESWSSPEARFEAIQAAAEDLSRDASVYKAEVPGYAPGDVSRVEREAERLTRSIGVPWVVLSNGVSQADFAAAVRAACAGGADGFLAGRAIWADTVADPDPVASIAARSVGRLAALTADVGRIRNSRQEGEAR